MNCRRNVHSAQQAEAECAIRGVTRFTVRALCEMREKEGDEFARRAITGYLVGSAIALRGIVGPRRVAETLYWLADQEAARLAGRTPDLDMGHLSRPGEGGGTPKGAAPARGRPSLLRAGLAALLGGAALIVIFGGMS